MYTYETLVRSCDRSGGDKEEGLIARKGLKLINKSTIKEGESIARSFK